MTEEEQREMLPSGRQTLFQNRVAGHPHGLTELLRKTDWDS
nr:winged helix-turn-helix domain-containing protein [Paenibacillus sp. Leaf72]